uniref:hypothetical protein n=1 Tax=Candidatus Methylacidiphilum fumarolicum TaxID=591154 RepID=UPI0024B67ADE|nr:hypothetical protein [Candidatus Methylacidiphilum fumarolicum]
MYLQVIHTRHKGEDLSILYRPRVLPGGETGKYTPDRQRDPVAGRGSRSAGGGLPKEASCSCRGVRSLGGT